MVVISDGSVVGRGRFLEAPRGLVGWLLVSSGGCWTLTHGQMELRMRRAPKMTRAKWRRTFKYRGIIWHTFVLPDVATPHFGCSQCYPPTGTPSQSLRTPAATRADRWSSGVLSEGVGGTFDRLTRVTPPPPKSYCMAPSQRHIRN